MADTLGRAVRTRGCRRCGDLQGTMLTAEEAEMLRRVFSLDTAVMERVPVGFATWLSMQPANAGVGAAGGPMAVGWAGRFMLVAPCGCIEPGVAARLVSRGRSACTSVRPTRVVLVVPNSGQVLLRARRQGVHVWFQSEGTGARRGMAVLVVENTQAKELPPGGRIGFAGTLRQNARRSDVLPSFNEVVHRTFDARTLGLQGGDGDGGRCISEAVRNQFEADRYATALGLLPRGTGDYLAAVLMKAGAPEKAARRAVEGCMDELREVALGGACRIVRRADRIRAGWWRAMPLAVVELGHDALAAVTHQRLRARRAAEFDDWQRRTKATVERRQRLHFVAERLGIGVRRLQREDPCWERTHRLILEGYSPVAAVDVWAGRLRRKPRVRPYNDGEYVLAVHEITQPRGGRPRGPAPGHAVTIRRMEWSQM